MTKYIDYARAMRQEEKKQSSKSIKFKQTFYTLLFIIIAFGPIGLWIYSKNRPPQFEVDWNEKVVSIEENKNQLDIPYSNPSAPLILENSFSAKVVNIYNPYSFKSLYLKNSEEQVKVASITKLLTALVVLEEYDLDDEITVTEDYSYLEWTLGLKVGDRILGWDLFKTMLIASYNDTAYIFADNYPGGWDEFVKKMDEKRILLDMNNSSFSNPAGLDFEGNYSTGNDLKKLINASLSNQIIKEVVQKKSETITFTRSGTEYTSFVFTTNDLLKTNENVKGLKTGNTLGAGQCLVLFFDDGKYPFVSVILGSKDRFGDAQIVINSVD